MKVEGDLRDKIVNQLADSDSRRIINSTLRDPKTTMAVGKELNLPLSTLYRKMAELKNCGLLMVDKVVVREDGKREPAYVCAFKEIVFRPGENGPELEIVFSERGKERRWFDLFFAKDGSGSPEQP